MSEIIVSLEIWTTHIEPERVTELLAFTPDDIAVSGSGRAAIITSGAHHG